ncbi:DUF4097 family beta strand repeat-containing protein [Kosmotoga sp.]|uniref:DUF4097 family beta strand repeat-containing protein n=1 Tax=Kosmotoga sp. TaxID=1955248 RepID=UPI0024AB770F|nr:DUF4097 family beta strand repeat-containing protein [Kosmotoga sp.]MDI3524228.1 lia operon protein LiaG [Kosmotoga sp.]MDK2953261.1 lia operon protein LiaG [Kosmotoga sp.]
MKSFTYELEKIDSVSLYTASADLEIISTKENILIAEVETDEEDYEPVVEIRGSELRIRFEKKEIKGFTGLFHNIFDNERIEKAKVYLPEKIERLKIGTASGDITISGVYLSDLRINAVSGDTSIFSGSAETFRLDDVSGDCVLKDFNFRDARFGTVSGDIRIVHLAPMSRDLTVSTVSGDLEVIYSQKPNVEVLLSTVSGDVFSKLPFVKEKKFYIIEADPEKPRERITMNSVSGDVWIKAQEGFEMPKRVEPRQENTFDDLKEEISKPMYFEEDKETEKTLKLFNDGKITEEHARQILSLLGYNDEEINELLGKGGKEE